MKYEFWRLQRKILRKLEKKISCRHPFSLVDPFPSYHCWLPYFITQPRYSKIVSSTAKVLTDRASLSTRNHDLTKSTTSFAPWTEGRSIVSFNYKFGKARNAICIFHLHHFLFLFPAKLSYVDPDQTTKCLMTLPVQFVLTPCTYVPKFDFDGWFQGLMRLHHALRSENRIQYRRRLVKNAKSPDQECHKRFVGRHCWQCRPWSN